MKKKINVGVIGCGYWGINLVRNFYNLGVLKAVADSDINTKKNVSLISKNVEFTTRYKELLNDDNIDAIVIATPARQHYQIVRESILHNKHVFVEKPLCLDHSGGKKLVNLAKKRNVKLMVGHLMLYHPAFRKMKEKIHQGLIGKIRYIYSNRLALGKLRKEEDILWSFAPHDISMILNLVDNKLIDVQAYGGSYLNSNVKDTSVTMLKFKNNIKAHIFVSWLHPYKDQRLVVIGEKGMIVFADILKESDKLLYYNHKVGWKGDLPIVFKAKATKIKFNYRVEPLKLECQSFLNWIDKDLKPPSDHSEGLEVLRVLSLAKKKLYKW